MTGVRPEPPPGLAAERTRLAWRRTTLAGVALVLIATSRAFIGGLSPVEMTAVAVMSLLWLASVGVAYRRIATLSHIKTLSHIEHSPPPGRAPALLALLITALAVIGLLLVT
jgi:uncharacterized membrane protein YidH (DUF202 family)